MSRHKMMHNLDLDEELYEDYDDEPEMTSEDRAQLSAALRTTRSRLPASLPAIPDREIEDLLWDSYYDVDKTVNQLVKKYTPKVPGVKKEVGWSYMVGADQDGNFGSSGADYSGFGVVFAGGLGISATAAGMFADMPWGKVDTLRTAEMVPVDDGRKGGLLGGSKLAALAKARKEKKEKEAAEAAAAAAAKNAGGAGETKKTAVSLLDRLGKKQAPAPSPSQETPAVKAEAPPKTDDATPPSVPLAKNEVPAAPSAIQEPPAAVSKPAAEPSPSEPAVPQVPQLQEEEKEPLKAAPSPFAASVFGARLDLVGENVVADTRVFTLLGKKAAKPTKDPFAEPSPDDKVMAAQAQSKGLNKNAGDTKRVEEGVKNMTIEQKEKPAIPPLTKIDVLKEYKESKEKENINFVVVGHVDAGKSTLMGRMLLDTGAIDQKVVDKFKREAEQIGKGSFHLAWVLDQTSEERNRGVTIDISINKFETERVNFTILDAPGHKDFVPNMIAGAAQADFAVLVIDASTGAFESGFHLRGQTKEHTLLVRSMGVQKIVVAVNKLDSIGWAEDRFTEIQQQMLTFLTNAGFQPQNIFFVPCSGLTGTNITRKPGPSEIPWYRGPTLLQHLESSHTYTRPVTKPLRLTVTDVFKTGPQNNLLTISGRIDSGYLQEGEPLIIIPSRELCYAKTIFVDDNPRKWAVAGHNVMIQLVQHDDELHPRAGDVVCKPSEPLKPLRTFRLKMLAFELITPMNVDVHKGVLHAPGRVTRLVKTMDKATGEVVKKKPRAVTPGTLAVCVVEMVGEGLVPLEAGMKVVLRSGGVSVAAGIVEG